MGLFQDVKNGEPVKELTIIHGFKFFKGYDKEGTQQVLTMCKKVVSVEKASPKLDKVTCKQCKSKFTIKKKYNL